VTARSAQARQLARLLAARAGVPVEVEWQGPRSRDGRYGGWRLQWADGPTAVSMRALVDELAPRVPAVPVGELAYGRNDRRQSLAVLLLNDLDRHPDRVHTVRPWDVADLHWRTDYPDRADQPTRQRATILLRLDRNGELTTDVLRQLAAHANPDWPAALAWLDAMVLAEVDPTVVKLADHRRTRSRVQGG